MDILNFNSYIKKEYVVPDTQKVKELLMEIESYLSKGCSRKDIYNALTKEPVNIKMTFLSFEKALYRIRKKQNKNLKYNTENNIVIKEDSINNESNIKDVPIENAFTRLKNEGKKGHQYSNTSSLKLDDIFGISEQETNERAKK